MKSAVSQQAVPRQGRPRKLSHDAVLDAALALLTEITPDEFTLAKLAGRLGASTMSLYTYYPSRDALLEAVAERAFARFQAPDAKDRWQDTVLAWLWALQRHVERYPVALRMMAWQGRVPMAWLKIWAPILKLLHGQGLAGRDLALAFDWFINAAIGLIVTEMHTIEVGKSAAIGDVGTLPPEDGMLLLGYLYDLQSLGREERFELGFRRLLDGLEAVIPTSRAS
jgi:AcrR family transcriptional regulator